MPQIMPKLAERIDVFASSLVRFGIPSTGAYYQAHGMVHMVLRHCERHMSDWLGTAAGVDKVLAWDSPPQVIAPAMTKAGLLICENTEYVFPYALTLCSRKTYRRWIDQSRQSFDVAKKRCLLVENPIPAAELVEDPERDLFGAPIHDSKEKPSTAPLGYQAIVEYWLREWTSKYGARYTFRSSDGKHVKRLLSKLDGETIKRAIGSYLACNQAFYEGHELSGLYSGINRWVAAERSNNSKHGVSYARADEDLPTAEL